MQKHAACSPLPPRWRSYVTNTGEGRSGHPAARLRLVAKTLLVMKLTVTLMICFMLNVQAKTISQTVTFRGKNVPLDQVLSAIEKQNQFFFFYDAELMRIARPVTISAEREPLESFLRRLFNDQPLSYSIDQKLIVVTKKRPEPTRPEIITAEEEAVPPPIAVKGRITTDAGEPVVASVTIKGTNSGTTTDANGFFELQVPNNQAILVISGVGIETREVSLQQYDGKPLSISVSTKATEELAAVVTGYTSQRKKDIIGSVAVVDVNALKSIPAGSALHALQGQASGVNIISNGLPGYASNIRIRGVTSFGNTNPLVLIDGVQGNLHDIPSDDVESIQVLKDAGAAAIYGVRGANGVIIVTTRKGKAGKAQTTYDSYVGIQTPVSPGWNMMNPTEYMEVYNKVNPGNPLFANGLPDYLWRGPGGSGAAMEGDPAVDPANYHFDPSNANNNYIIQRFSKEGTDWFKEIMKPALMTSHNLTTAGGTDRLNYMFSAGYLDQQGILMNTFLKRYSLRVNTQYKLRNNIRIGENLYAYYKNNPQENPNNPYNSINDARGNKPFIPVYDIMGNWGGGYAGALGVASNPVALRTAAANNRAREVGLQGNVFAEVDFLKNFTLRTSYGGNVKNFYSETFTPNNYFHGEQYNNKNSLTEYSGYALLSMWTNTLTYRKNFDRHSLTGLVGTEAIQMLARNMTASRQNFFSEAYDYLILPNGTANWQNTSAASDDAFFSVFGRVDYAYDDKYLLGATLRRDGSSRFGPAKRYGWFPSITAGWRISGEKFMDNVHFVSDLKLRASYGIIGNAENITVFNSATLYSQSMNSSYYDISGSTTGTTPGFQPSNIGNPSAGWEKNIVTNIGLDASLFRNKLDFTVEYFVKRIEGLLFSLPLPTSIAGSATTPTVNIGDIRNRGVDFNATYHARIGADARLDIGANITTYKNTIDHIPAPGYFDPSWTPGNSVRNQEGQAVGAFYGYRVIGLFQSDDDVAKSPTQDGAAPGRFKYEDVNGDGVITPLDRTFIGNPNPDFVYGINLGFSYKRFDLSAIFYGSQGNEIWNETRRYSDFFAGGNTNKSRRLLNAWTPENPNTNVPKLEGAASFSTLNVANTYFLEDGSYLRMRSLQLGYNFDVSRWSNVGINKLRVYVQAANLFTITNYSGADPEITSYRTQTFGIDEGYYPNARNILFGLNLGF